MKYKQFTAIQILCLVMTLIMMVGCTTFEKTFNLKRRGQTSANRSVTPGGINALSEDMPARTIRIEIQEIDDVDKYEVQVIPYEQKWAEPQKSFSETNKLRFRLTPGKYKAQTRAYLHNGDVTPWSEFFDFKISYRAPSALKPPDGKIIEPISSEKEKILFEWPAQENIHGYLFELYKEGEDKPVVSKIMDKNWTTEWIYPMTKYKWSVAYLAYQGAENEEKLAKTTQTFKVGPPPVYTKESAIKITPIKGASKYEFEVVSDFSDEDTGESRIFSSPKSKFQSDLKPGRYEIRARFFDGEGTMSDWSPPQVFFVAFKEPEAIGTKEQVNLESDDPEKSSVTLRWERKPRAHKYVLRIYDKDRRHVQTIETKKTRADIKVPAGEEYYWDVNAYSQGETIRAPASVQAENLNKFSIENFIEHEFTKAEEPSAFYGYGRYIISQFGYRGKNFDSNTLTTQAIFGGTGEMAAGYWLRRSKFGILARSGLSGFDLNGQNFTYWEHSLMLGYRRILTPETRLRIWAGWTWKELPELITEVAQDEFSINKLAGNGPTIQVSYLRPIWRDYGLHLLGTIYYSLEQNTAPNGNEQFPMRSYQFGAFVTMPVWDNEKGMIGYTYKYEQAGYPSTDTSQQDNIFSYEGHFLSFILEFGWRSLIDRSHQQKIQQGKTIKEREK